MTPLAYRIGHGSYQGANGKPVIVRSKGAAVVELRRRGCKRDDARRAVNSAESGSFAQAKGYDQHVEIIGWEVA